MNADRANSEQTLLSDDEIRERHLNDPEVQARIRETLEKIQKGDQPGPGITAEELPEFLREHG